MIAAGGPACSSGAEIARSIDTEDALRRLARESFGAIISDMGRPSHAQAGYVLLKAMRDAGDTTPFFIYSTSGAPEHDEEARNKGGQGSTNDPRILTEMLVTELSSVRG